MIRLVLFASGSGTNVENIIRFFEQNPDIEIVSVCSNNPRAFVLERAKKLGIPSVIFNRRDFYETDRVVQHLRSCRADWIILAGFLWLVPENLLAAYPDRIVNIHPALLPKYGGKGMYGERVHQAVINNGDKESGITIHFVNSAYDRGKILFQARCPVNPEDTAETLAQRVHQLEYEFYPKVIEEVVKGKRENKRGGDGEREGKRQ
jgi:phosphoribosylglycinamide formyltransferase-1